MGIRNLTRVKTDLARLPEEARALLDESGVVCRVGELMLEDLTVET